MTTAVKRERIVALDIIRGYFLIVILIDHLGLFPSPFEFITGRGLLWASAAEGFFLISGLLVGYIYAQRIVTNFWQSSKKIYKRAALLYVWAVIITLLMVAWGNAAADLQPKAGLWINPPIGNLLLETLSLQYTYGWADFLRYYAVYMLFAPLALWLCSRSKAWLLLGLSFGVWLLFRDGYFAAIQLMFMAGIVIGFYLPSIRTWYKALTAPKQRYLMTAIAAGTVVTLLLSVLAIRVAVPLMGSSATLSNLPLWSQAVVRWLYDVSLLTAPLTDKFTLGPLRIAIALLWFTALYLLTRRYESAIDRVTQGSLRIVGENSLLIYIAHAILVYGILLFVQPAGIIANTAITAVSLVVIYVIAKYRKVPAKLLRRLND